MTKRSKKEGDTNEHLKSQQGDQQGDHDPKEWISKQYQ
jgi:hypothetical protein